MMLDGRRKVAESTITTLREMCCSPVLAEPLPAPAAHELAAALKVLADPARLRLLSLIRASDGGRAVTRELVNALQISQPTVSHHLGVLHDAGFVERERDGRETWYSIVPDSLQTIRQLLDPYPD